MKSKRLLKFLKDLEQLGRCFMHEDAITQFLHDHHEELWHLGMVEEETIYSYAILALNQELTPDELEVLTELEDYGAALVGEGLALGHEFGILAGREQLFQEEPTQTPYRDFIEMLEALDMEQWPDAFRSRISAICQCEKAIHSLFQSRCDDEDEVEELMQMVFAVTEAWLVRPHGAIQLFLGSAIAPVHLGLRRRFRLSSCT